MPKEKQKRIVFALTVWILTALFFYLNLQTPGILSKKALLSSIALGFSVCALAWIFFYKVYGTIDDRKVVFPVFGKISIVIFVILFTVRHDLPKAYFLALNSDISISFNSESLFQGTAEISYLHDGFSQVNNKSLVVVKNAYLKPDKVVVSYTAGHPGIIDWKGKVWNKFYLVIENITDPVEIRVSSDNKIETVNFTPTFPGEKKSLYVSSAHSRIVQFTSEFVVLVVYLGLLLFLSWIAVFFLYTIAKKIKQTGAFVNLTLNNPFITIDKKIYSYWETFGKTRHLSFLFTLFMLFLIVAINLWPLFQNKYPLGFAGLFLYMGDLLEKNNLVPPMQVAYYGPGGIPFAYPFFSFYFSTFITKLFGINQWQYSIFAPISFYLISMLLIYQISNILLNSRVLAAIAVFISSSSVVSFTQHATSGGMVRCLALMLSLAGIYLYLLSRKKKREFLYFLLSGFLLGLSFMTHLTYGIFGACVICSFLLFEQKPFREKILHILILAMCAIITTMPWWLMVIRRYGLETLVYAFQTHGTQGFINSLLDGRFKSLSEHIIGQVQVGNKIISTIFSGTIIFSYLFNINPLIMAWLCVIIIMGESARFSALLFGPLLLMQLKHIAPKLRDVGFFTIGILGFIMFLIFLGRGYYNEIRLIRSDINNDFLDAADVLRDLGKESEDYKYFLVDKNHSRGEWLPYLAHATPANAHWGAEWTGNYHKQTDIRLEVMNCLSSSKKVDCFRILNDQICSSECNAYLVDNQYSDIIAFIKTELGLFEEYTNQQYTLLAVKR